MSSNPPPAPFVGPTRADVLRRLRGRRADVDLPIVLGRGEPQAIIRREGDAWVLRRLETDPAQLREIERTRISAGYYVPEHAFGALGPGAVLLQHSDRESFINSLEALEWTFGT